MSEEGPRMSREEALTLEDLQRLWSGAYVIIFDGVTWMARYFADPADLPPLSANSAEGLRLMIHSDYHLRKSPHPPGGKTDTGSL